MSAVATICPRSLTSLSREHYAGIRLDARQGDLGGRERGFTVEPLHRGSVFGDRVTLFLVEDGLVRPVRLRSAPASTMGGPPLPAFKDDPGYLRHPHRVRGSAASELAEFAIFQGATFFRAGRGRARISASSPAP